MTLNGNWKKSWALAAEYILSVMLVRQDGTFETILGELGISRELFPAGNHQTLFDTVLALASENKPIDELNLYAAAPDLDAAWLAGVYDLYDDGQLDELPANAGWLKLYGATNAALQKLGQAETRLCNGEAVHNVVNDLMVQLYTPLYVPPLPTHAGDLGGELMDQLTGVTPVNYTRIDFGHSWFNSLIPIWRNKQLLMIISPYKQRKSTLGRNILLGALRGGARVVMCQLEDGAETLRNQIIVMMAVEYMIQQGQQQITGKITNTGPEVNLFHAFDGETLMLAGRDFLSWNPIIRTAIEYAITEFRAFGDRFHVLDMTKARGGIRTVIDIKRRTAQIEKMYGKVHLVGLDYLGLLSAPSGDELKAEGIIAGRMYGVEKTDFDIRYLQELCGAHDYAGLILGQQNEESIKQTAAAKQKQYSPGARGGAAIPSAASYLFTTEYGENTQSGDDSHIWIQLKLARFRGAPHALRTQVLPIHKESGLIYDKQKGQTDKQLELL